MDELRAAKPKIHSPHACFPAVNSCPFHSGLSAMSLVSLCFLLVMTPFKTYPIHLHCPLSPALYAPAPHTSGPRGTPLLTPSTPSRPPPHTPSPLGPPPHISWSPRSPPCTPLPPGVPLCSHPVPQVLASTSGFPHPAHPFLPRQSSAHALSPRPLPHTPPALRAAGTRPGDWQAHTKSLMETRLTAPSVRRARGGVIRGSSRESRQLLPALPAVPSGC